MPNSQLPTHASQIFYSFVKVQEAVFPDYMDELRGIADGSRQPLVAVLLMNLDEELSYFLPNASLPARRVRVRPRRLLSRLSL